MGLIAFGKLESGQMKKGMKAVLMPDRRPVVIEGITHQDREVDHAVSGDNVKVKLKNVEEEVCDLFHFSKCFFPLGFIITLFCMSPSASLISSGSQARICALFTKRALPYRYGYSALPSLTRRTCV